MTRRGALLATMMLAASFGLWFATSTTQRNAPSIAFNAPQDTGQFIETDGVRFQISGVAAGIRILDLDANGLITIRHAAGQERMVCFEMKDSNLYCRTVKDWLERGNKR